MCAEVRVSLYPKIPVSQRPQVVTSHHAAEYFRHGWEDLNYRESFKAMFLNRSNKIIGIREVGVGGITGVVVDLRLIFQAALGCNATSMILAHNHPSGNLTPSENDLRVTRKIKDAGVIMDIHVIDHVILTEDEYYSFADEGTL